MKNKRLIISVALILLLVVGGLALYYTVFRETQFDLNDGLDKNGFFKGVKALNYVELFDYNGMFIPAAVHVVCENDLQEALNNHLLINHMVPKGHYDREVEWLHRVNMDFDIYIDGEPIEDGSSEGEGRYFLIHPDGFFDGFYEQLIGRMPGETVDVKMTFPEDYGIESRAGRDGVFVVTINYVIFGEDYPKLTDEFVLEELSEMYGWTSAEEVRSVFYADLQRRQLNSYILEFMAAEVAVRSVLRAVMKYHEREMVFMHELEARRRGLDFEEYLESRGYKTGRRWLEQFAEEIRQNAVRALVLQAIAEDSGIVVPPWDYSMGTTGTPRDIKEARNRTIISHIIDNAVLE
jgi:trigger factor